LGIILLWMYLVISQKKSCNLMIVLGSGGHTHELLRLLATLPTTIDSRSYIIADSDTTSESKVKEFQANNMSQYEIIRIPRCRAVHQTWISTPFTTCKSFLYCIIAVFQKNPKVIVCNGPGTCVPMCITGYIYKKLFLGQAQIIFIESFARVYDLSLSAKILYYIADRFIVQWPELIQKYPKSQYYGQLV
jgi:beta-1,4-N-acetylglucosaminyltransferase